MFSVLLYWCAQEPLSDLKPLKERYLSFAVIVCVDFVATQQVY